jgi:hypothetical protein
VLRAAGATRIMERRAETEEARQESNTEPNMYRVAPHTARVQWALWITMILQRGGCMRELR